MSSRLISRKWFDKSEILMWIAMYMLLIEKLPIANTESPTNVAGIPSRPNGFSRFYFIKSFLVSIS